MIPWKVRYWWQRLRQRWTFVSHDAHMKALNEERNREARERTAAVDKAVEGERKKLRELLTVLVRVKGFVDHPDMRLYVTTTVSAHLFRNGDDHIRGFLAQEIGRDVEQKVSNLRILEVHK